MCSRVNWFDFIWIVSLLCWAIKRVNYTSCNSIYIDCWVGGEEKKRKQARIAEQLQHLPTTSATVEEKVITIDLSPMEI